jgi:hypothetical protein
MTYIHDKGSPDSEVWVVLTKPLPTDTTRKYIFSSGTGYVFDKMMKEAQLPDYYVTCYLPDTTDSSIRNDIHSKLNSYQPKIILAVDAAGGKLCNELIPRRQGKSYDPDEDSEISKYCGSLLRSPHLNYPHYVIPIIHPTSVNQQYKLRDQLLLDLVKVAYELQYIKERGDLQPLPIRTLITEFSCFDELLYIIDSMGSSEYISNDIETTFLKKDSTYYGRTPGYPVVIALANSQNYAISFEFFRETPAATRELWLHLDNLFQSCITIGQNFHNFDSFYYEYCGFEFPEEHISDTLIRHHILWPELPHKLQYMTRQYTREPYYKDEGQGWSLKNMKNLKLYNAKDAAVTYEVWLAQEDEFRERPHLR